MGAYVASSFAISDNETVDTHVHVFCIFGGITSGQKIKSVIVG
jgi:hypothetical protein